MPRITRKQQKVFAANASNNGVFGSLQANDPVCSQDPDVIQSRTAYENGWNDATLSAELLPPLEEFQGLQYLFSRQLSYVFQEGVPEWETNTTYYTGSICKTISGTRVMMFVSLVNNNQGNLTSDTTKWYMFFDSNAAYANVNLDNLTSTGKNISNWSSNTTNCITEIPQDINLMLSSGTLTLKADSKVYVPNGFEQDGVTPKFDTVTIANDVTVTSTASGGASFVYYLPSANTLVFSFVSGTGSGTTTPSSGVYYNTSVNQIGAASSGSLTDKRSFPIAIVQRTGSISSIDQVFNGMGYIGSTSFGLPGLKGLIPNGRNADGTLKNFTFSFSKALTYTENTTNNFTFIANSTTLTNSTVFSYDADSNYNRRSDTGEIINACAIGTYTRTSGVISNFKPRTPFHAVDYSDVFDGNHIYSGNNTYTGQIITNNDLAQPIRISNQGITRGTAPSVAQESQVRVDDKDGNWIGLYGSGVTTANVAFSRLLVRGVNATSSGELSVRCDPSNNIYTSAPTPSSATDNSTKIATTAWCHNFLNSGSSMPNYAAGSTITLTTSTPYTATQNGFVVASDVSAGVNVSTLYINNIEVGKADITSYYIYRINAVYPINKNDVLSMSANVDHGTLTFYPLKGV